MHVGSVRVCLSRWECACVSIHVYVSASTSGRERGCLSASMFVYV